MSENIIIHVDKGTVRVDGIKIVIMAETCTLLRALRENIGNDELEKIISGSRKSEKEIKKETKDHILKFFDKLFADNGEEDK